MIAPVLTASTTLSANANTWACANPPTILPSSIEVGAGNVLAISMIWVKSFLPSTASICVQPGNPEEPVVKILSWTFPLGGTIQFVVNSTGPLNDSNSSFCFHHALP